MRRSAEFAVAVLGTLLVAAPANARSADGDLSAAVAARDAGRTQEAIERLEALARSRPTDATILRLLGTSYAAAARYRDAAATLDRAQAVAPVDHDIALARARVALWSDRLDKATKIVDEIAAAEPANAELPALRASLGAARVRPSSPGIAIAQAFSRVSLRGGRRTWSETVLAVDFAVARQATLTGEIERFDRGATLDTRGGVRLDTRIAPGLRGYVGASATPNADFRERWALRAGGEASLGGAFTATLDTRYANYSRTGIVLIEPGLRVRTVDARSELAVRSINLFDETGKLRTGIGARVDASLSGSLRVFAGAATYSDAEAGVTRRVDGAFAGADMTLTRRLAVRITVDRERRVATYRRSGVTFGLRWRPAR